MCSARWSAQRRHPGARGRLLRRGSGVVICVSNYAWVRGYVLNKLEDGPVRVDDLIRFGETEFGFSRDEIWAAGEHFAVIAQNWEGDLYWMRPENLFAIWWGVRRHPLPCMKRAPCT